MSGVEQEMTWTAAIAGGLVALTHAIVGAGFVLGVWLVLRGAL